MFSSMKLEVEVLKKTESIIKDLQSMKVMWTESKDISGKERKSKNVKKKQPMNDDIDILLKNSGIMVRWCLQMMPVKGCNSIRWISQSLYLLFSIFTPNNYRKRFLFYLKSYSVLETFKFMYFRLLLFSPVGHYFRGW